MTKYTQGINEEKDFYVFVRNKSFKVLLWC